MNDSRQRPVETPLDVAIGAGQPLPEERPPLGGWGRLYAIVLGELLLLIVLFTLFARAFS